MCVVKWHNLGIGVNIVHLNISYQFLGDFEMDLTHVLLKWILSFLKILYIQTSWFLTKPSNKDTLFQL